MIDESRLIEELKESGMIADNEYGNSIVEFIENQPKIGEWIPVDERLPVGKEYEFYDEEEGITLYKHVLVSIKNDNVPVCVAFFQEGTWFDAITMFPLDVIAWMHLPEIYKEES